MIGAGFDPEALTCGLVLLRNHKGEAFVCGSALVSWVPVAHVRMSGTDRDGNECYARAVMGALAMCERCRLRFKFSDLEKYPLWDGMLSQFREQWGQVPEARYVQVEFLSVAEFLEKENAQ